MLTNNQKYQNAVEGVEFVTCKCCGLKASQLSKHVKSAHVLTTDQYYEKFNCDKTALMCKNYLDQLTTRALTRNPSKGHGGKYSAHSPKFIKYRGLSEQEVAERIAKVKAYATAKRIEIPSSTTLAYWLQRTNGDVEQATELQSDRQRTFSLKKCIEKYGEEDGYARWCARQKKWSESFTKSGAKTGVSNISNDLIAQLPKSDSVRSAYHNSEMAITVKVVRQGKVAHKVFRPDYVDTTSKKIIEFFGDYFHANPKKYNAGDVIRQSNPPLTAAHLWENDKQRADGYTDAGYKVHIVWENDFRKSPQQVLEQCLHFLNN
jgi:G:T-mismatch repair DNA endonuclease (very short patch repair protein)